MLYLLTSTFIESKNLLFMPTTIFPASFDVSQAYHALPPIIQTQLSTRQRVILIANNPSIRTEVMDEILQPSDLVVLFNNPFHTEYFATAPLASTLPKMLFFRQVGDSVLHFGLPPKPNKALDIAKMADTAPLGFLFANIAYQYPTRDDDLYPDPIHLCQADSQTLPALLKERFVDEYYTRIIPEQHDVVADYPYFSDIHSSASSSGFFIYRLMLAVQHHLNLLASTPSQKTVFEIIMLGFNHDQQTPYFWHGHNWQFERQELATPKAGVKVITQY